MISFEHDAAGDERIDLRLAQPRGLANLARFRAEGLRRRPHAARCPRELDRNAERFVVSVLDNHVPVPRMRRRQHLRNIENRASRNAPRQQRLAQNIGALRRQDRL